MELFGGGFWIVLALAAYFFWRYVVPDGDTPTDPEPAQAVPTQAVYDWPSLGDFDFEVVGESYCQKAIERLAGEHGDQSPDLRVKAVLVPVSNNPHDDKAVRVEVDGYLVGHLSRENARSFRRRLGAKKLGAVPTGCDALIVGGFLMDSGSRASYGVCLDIKPFD